MLRIENVPPDKPYMGELLRQKFSDYRRVVVKKPFTAGLSGGDVFMIRTIKRRGAELPSVIKIDRAASIKREWQTYQEVIQRCLPGETAVDGEPVYTDDHQYGLLWYPLAGQGSYEVKSLLDFLDQEALDNLHPVLVERLFRNLNVLWQTRKKAQGEFSFQVHYDSFLPPHLQIEVGHPTPGEPIKELQVTGRQAGRALQIGDWVQIEGCKIVTVTPKDQTISLDAGERGTPFRILAQLGSEIETDQYQEGERLGKPLLGKVVHTRHSLVEVYLTQAAGGNYPLAAETLTLPGGKAYPNPARCWQRVLNESCDVYVGAIHGDLNLNNVLVEVESGTVHLIDFAYAQHTHLLRDCFHLEMSLVITLLTKVLWQQEMAPTRVCQFYEWLHQSFVSEPEITAEWQRPFLIFKCIRQAARPHLFVPDDWSEYYRGLFLYFLGALQFATLDDQSFGSLPRRLLFLGMAVLLKLLPAQQPTQVPDDHSQLPERPDEPVSGHTLIEGNENIVGDHNRVNAQPQTGQAKDGRSHRPTVSSNVIKGDGNIIGSHNERNSPT